MQDRWHSSWPSGRHTRNPHLSKVQNLQFYSDDILLSSYKLVLVPVWIGEAEFEDKTLNLLVNGKSGKVYMDKPGGWVKKALNWLDRMT